MTQFNCTGKIQKVYVDEGLGGIPRLVFKIDDNGHEIIICIEGITDEAKEQIKRCFECQS